MDFEDYETLQDWLNDQLEENNDKWENVIYHNLNEEELSKKWTDDVQRIFLYTEDRVYLQYYSENFGWFMDHVDRNPPIPLVDWNGKPLSSPKT